MQNWPNVDQKLTKRIMLSLTRIFQGCLNDYFPENALVAPIEHKIRKSWPKQLLKEADTYVPKKYPTKNP